MPPLRIFISHAHEDKPLADALKTLVSAVFPPGATQTVKVDYSSDDSPEGGPAAGTDWLEWILRVVRETDVCIVILTADSVSAPWLMWEAGAMTGVVVSTSAPTDRQVRVTPLLFGVGLGGIPAPLQNRQALNGENERDVMRLLYGLHTGSAGSGALPDTLARHAVSEFVQEVQIELKSRMLGRPLKLWLTDGVPVYFVNSRYGLALEPYKAQIGNGVKLFCGQFNGDSHQGWVLYPVRHKVYKLCNSSHLTQCISIENDSERPKATALLWKYEAHETQHWTLESHSGTSSTLDTVRLVNSASSLCLQPRLGDKLIVQMHSEGYVDEDWLILAAPTLVR